MITWEPTGSGLRALDRSGNEVEVEIPEWSAESDPHRIPRPVDTTVAGEAASLQFGPTILRVTDLVDETSYELGNDVGPVELPASQYLVNVHQPVKTYVRFDGAATLRKSDDYQDVRIEFPARTTVTFGFRSHADLPPETVTVPGTPEGLATGLSTLHSTIQTTSPDRSFPTLRGHPPRLAVGDRVEIPDSIEETVADTGIELVTPRSFDELFVLAPLAYYLQADVRVEERSAPVLRAPDAGVAHELSPAPELQYDAAALLQRIFFLDSLVRNEGPHGTDLAELDEVGDLGFDPATLYTASPAERLRGYLSTPIESIESTMPEWHLSMYVEPTTEHARCLPYLLDRLSLIYLPSTSELSGQELMDRSLDDFYRGVRAPGQDGPFDGSVASVERVDPKLETGRTHGWLADGTPIDVFKAIYEAFENRLDHLTQDRESVRVRVILNDDEMQAEHDEVARLYRERAEALPIDVTVDRYLSRDELAAEFEAKNDFVHYIGHCEEDGLRCRDGNLSISELDECNTQTFFLNACGSYYEGMELIRKGSVAGAVTFSKVLNKHAAKVGTTFARLLFHGFSFQRSLQLARRRIMMGKDYVVVGDGSHALTQSKYHYPSKITLEQLSDDRYRIVHDTFSTTEIGGYYQVYTPDNDRSHLSGNKTESVLDSETLRDVLEMAVWPVIHDGAFYWPEEVIAEFGLD